MLVHIDKKPMRVEESIEFLENIIFRDSLVLGLFFKRQIITTYNVS